MLHHGVRTPLETNLKRRHVLAGVGGVGVVAALSPLVGGEAVAATVSGSRWSDPVTWGGQVPAPGSVVTVRGAVLLDVNVSLAGLVIAPGASLTFTTGKSLTLTSTGNIVVYGSLIMKPSSITVVHRLVFAGVDESKFVGGGMDVLPSDVGLWVKDAGRLDIAGTPRTPWARSQGSAPLGAVTLTLDRVPSGWRAGDELVVCPTASPRETSAHTQFDEVSIKSISGSVVTLTKPLKFAHPAVAVGDGKVMTAEVMNLTRNVRIEGTSTGRTHTWVGMVSRPQSVRFASFRHFGPRQQSGGVSTEVLGRYGLHLHMGYDAVRGSVLEGLVARDGGNHAFVPHLSNGVTVTGCVSYNTVETPFWWDDNPDTRTDSPPSDDISFIDCVAAKVLSEPVFRGFRLAGYQLGSGEGNRINGCVAVGVQGNQTAAGFVWQEARNPGVWVYDNNVSHNNKIHGIFVWQNSPRAHVVARFVNYHNGAFGISHGAYRNGYGYRDSILYGNAKGGIELHAVSKGAGDSGLRFENLLIDGAGIAPYGVEVVSHTLDPNAATVFRGCRVVNQRSVAFCVSGRQVNSNTTKPDYLDIVGCTITGQALWLGEKILPESIVRIVSDASITTVTPKSSVTTALGSRDDSFNGEWNGMVRTTSLSAELPDVTPVGPVPSVPEPVAPAPTPVALRLRRVQKPKKVVRRRRVVRSRRRRR